MASKDKGKSGKKPTAKLVAAGQAQKTATDMKQKTVKGGKQGK